MNPTIKFKKLNENAKIPTYAHEGDAGMDLYSTEDKILLPGERYLFKTGLAMELEKGFGFIIKDKSGLAHKHGLTTLGGVIEYTYRGEIGVILLNTSKKEVFIEKHQKIAQAIIIPIAFAKIEETKDLSKTTRGEGGFGSTGKK
ncbi:MAG: dUTP diphosphatase [Candidatus Woesearchaeota archaeon]